MLGGMILLWILRSWLPARLVRFHQKVLLALSTPGPAAAFVLLVGASMWPVAVGVGVLLLFLASREASHAGDSLPPNASPEEWMRLVVESFPGGRYGDVRILGQGGMARIFRVRDLRLDRDVAFKLMDPALLPDATMRARFVREGRAMAALHHPGLPMIHDVADAPIPYMVMSFIEGETLADRFERLGPASSDEVRSWMIQAAEALGHAHQAGIIHRDVKPENLMIDQAGRIWVIDFGIARFESQAAITRVGTVMGTPLFLSPEQIGGHDPHILNDVYSLGATAFFMVSGKYPYTLQELVGASGEPAKALPEQVDPTLAAAIQLAVSHRPEDRPSSMRALVEMLR